MVGLFDPSFRGAGSPGAPGVGSTQRGLQLVEQGKNTLQGQRLGLERQREGRVGERDQARIQSLIRGATLLKQIKDPRQKIEFLRGRVGELRRAGISSGDSEEALALAEAGDFAGLEQVTDEAIALGRGAQESFTLSPGQTRFQGSTPIAFGGEDPEAAEKRVAEELAQSKTTFDQSAKLRGEIAKSAAGFDKVVASFDRISASENTGPGDLSLIFNFMKMLDPGSVVREGEFASAENAGGVPERVRNFFNKLNTGERLTPKQRESFLSQSKALFKKSKQRHDKTIKGFINLASQLGIEQSLVVLPRGEEIEASQTADNTLTSSDITSLSDEELFNF